MIYSQLSPKRVYFGKDSSEKLINIIRNNFKKNETLYFVDQNFFTKNTNKKVVSFLNGQKKNLFLLENKSEPKTNFIDNLMVEIKAKYKNISLVVGIGGGSTLDITKAVSNLLTNRGNASQYQGWDLLKNPSTYKIGVPTISGTGAESSKTCVLTNEKTFAKLGMNSKYSVFDELILDPTLSSSVPRKQYFYSAMDAYIHSIESLRGRYRNPISDHYSILTIQLIKEIFLSDSPKNLKNREKLMLASLYGGFSVSSSYVGLIHPVSAALSVVYKLPHCYSNCLAFNALKDFYKLDYVLFNQMKKKYKIKFPKLINNLSNKKLDELVKATLLHKIPLINAVGKKNLSKINHSYLEKIFNRI